MSRSVKLNYEQYRVIRPQSIEVSIGEDGTTYVTAQVTEEQMKLLNRGTVGGLSIAEDKPTYERIEWKPGQGFVIEDQPERDTLSEQS